MADTDKKITFEELCKQIKVMRPGAVMQFIAKQFSENPAEFVAKHSIGILGKAMKEGWTSVEKLSSAIGKFNQKNKEDDTKIDMSKAQIDPQTVRKSCLFDGKFGRAIAEFIKNFKNGTKDVAEEAKKAEEKLESDAKKRGVDIKDEDLKGKDLAVASVIDDEKNDKLKGDELKEKAISTAENAEEIKKIKKESEKTASEMDQKVKVDDAALKQAEEDIKSGKADKELQAAAKKSGKTDEQKKTDKLQKQIKASLTKLVGKDNPVGVSIKNCKNMKAYMKKRLGKTLEKLEQLEEGRFVILALRLANLDGNETYKKMRGDQTELIPSLKSVFKKMLETAKNQLKDSAGKSYFIRQALGDEDKDGFDMYLVIEIDVDKLNEAMLDESDLNESSSVDIKDLAGAVAAKSAIMAKSMSPEKQEDAKDLFMKWLEKASEENFDDPDDAENFRDAAEMQFQDILKNGEKAVSYDMMTDNAKRIANKLVSASVDDYVEINDYDSNEIEDISKQIASNVGISDKMADQLASVNTSDANVEFTENGMKITGNIRGMSAQSILDQALNDNNIGTGDKQHIYKLFSGGFGNPAALRAAKNKLGMEITQFMAGYDKDPEKTMKVLLAGHTAQQKDALAEIFAKIKPDSAQYAEKLGVKVDGTISGLKDAGKTVKNIASVADPSDISPEQLKFKDVVPMDQHGRVFSPSVMLKRLSDLDDAGDDGFDANELHKVQLFSTQIKDYQQWAIDHASSKDPEVLQRISQIKFVSKQFNEFLDDNNITIDPARVADAADIADAAKSGSDVKSFAAGAATGKASAAIEPVKSSWSGILGGISMSTLVWARVAMKTTSLALKYGKGAIDAFGAMAVKRKEDANVIAEMTFIMKNGEDSDMKLGDTKFSVRFDIEDMKWHATNLDDRKMKLPEEEIIKKALESEEGKKFKQQCLQIWEQIVKPDDPANSTVVQILTNPEAFGLKQQDSAGKFGKTITKLKDSFDEIKSKFA